MSNANANQVNNLIDMLEALKDNLNNHRTNAPNDTHSVRHLLAKFLVQSKSCLSEYISQTLNPDLAAYPPGEAGFCPPYYDQVSCWPATPPGTLSSHPCPDRISGIKYMSGYNATRYCESDGNWSDRANYSNCRPEILAAVEGPLPFIHLEIMYYMYWVGYSVSLLVLIIALAIFLHYKSLWCLRNIIHTNLIMCFGLHNVVWICYSVIGHEIMAKKLDKEITSNISCLIPTTLLKYFIAAGFFWMFVEGGYLFITVMFSFYARKIRFWMCAIIGWGVPCILVTVATIVKAHNIDQQYCWNEQYVLDYIFIGPVLFLLFVNLIFLFVIMWVIIIKLQQTVRQEAKRYKKAIKALLILCPLLGINYVLVLVQPQHGPLWLQLIFSYYITAMTSSQGLLVAIFFCLRNNEVMDVLKMTYKNAVDSWRDRRRTSLTSYLYLKLMSTSETSTPRPVLPETCI